MEKAILKSIENNREVSWESDYDFLFEFQKSMLLALKEHGTLNEIQYRYAEKLLKEQVRTIVKKQCIRNQETGGEKHD